MGTDREGDEAAESFVMRAIKKGRLAPLDRAFDMAKISGVLVMTSERNITFLKGSYMKTYALVLTLALAPFVIGCDSSKAPSKAAEDAKKAAQDAESAAMHAGDAAKAAAEDVTNAAKDAAADIKGAAEDAKAATEKAVEDAKSKIENP